MTVTLLMAISIDGFIAGAGDDTAWVKDLETLTTTITKYGVVVMGRRTYQECVKYDAFPYKNALNIVMTRKTGLQTKNSTAVIFTEKNPLQVLNFVHQKGFNSLLLIGGGHLNGSFLKENLIDEIILDIHPLLLSKGIHLFESEFQNQELKLVSSTHINDQIIQLKYRLKK